MREQYRSQTSGARAADSVAEAGRAAAEEGPESGQFADRAQETADRAREKATMNTPTATLNGWTADELFAEVLSRSAGDRSALNLIQAKMLRALLDHCDQSGRRD